MRVEILKPDMSITILGNSYLLRGRKTLCYDCGAGIQELCIGSIVDPHSGAELDVDLRYFFYKKKLKDGTLRIFLSELEHILLFNWWICGDSYFPSDIVFEESENYES